MLPAMMRQALPKPQRKNLAQRRAEAHLGRKRNHTTAKQMMAGPVRMGRGGSELLW